MPSTFSSRAGSDDARPHSWNGEHEAEPAPAQAAGSSFSPSPDAHDEEMREDLAAARRRLQYFEGFAPWIEEQMATVVERAAQVAGESEREQERIGAELERQRAEMERLVEECDRLRTEAETIVTEANASAERVIEEANTRAARLLAEAQQNAESMVNRLRDEAAAIVTRALGDITALEATDPAADQPAAVDQLAAPIATPSTSEPEEGDAGDQSSARGDASQLGEREPESDLVVEANSDAPAVETDEPVGDGLRMGPSVDETVSAVQNEAEPDDRSGPPPASPVASEADAQGDTMPDAAEPGSFQWLGSALSGRDAASDNGNAEKETEEHPAVGATFSLLDGPARSQGPDPEADDTFITRLTIHPAFTAHDRGVLQRAVEGMTGVERVSLGAVTEDFFELLITHQLYTSVLGSLLTAAGEHIRLIAQHDDSLEVEVTGLDWVRIGEGAAEASRASDA